MPKAKVAVNRIIPDHCDLHEVMVYKYKDDQREVMCANDVEEFSDSDDDTDYMPSIDEETDEEADAYEDTPLSQKEKAELEAELEKLIQDQELEVQWQEYNKD